MPGLFRETRTASTATLAVWTALQSAAIWTATLVVLPAALVATEAALGIERFALAGQVPLAVALFAVFSALNASAGASMVRWGRGTPLPTACAPRLVVRGPYAHVRNPMALFGLGQGLAVGLGLGSWLTLAAVVVGGVLWHTLVRPAEEADLERRLGDGYAAYQAAVPLWIPRLRPYRPT
ncbi:MAG: isoprenylcysteine carboxylmethyltransferase family protein [Bacteroidota bacterium]